MVVLLFEVEAADADGELANILLYISGLSAPCEQEGCIEVNLGMAQRVYFPPQIVWTIMHSVHFFFESV